MIARHQFNGAEAFAAMLSQVNGDVVQYGKIDPSKQGTRWSTWSCTVAPLPHGAVTHFTSAGPLAGTGRTQADEVVLLMPWMDRIPHIYRGVEMPPNGAAFFGPNAEYAGRCDADHAFTVFLISAERARGFLDHILGPDSMPADGCFLPVDLPKSARSELETLVAELTGMAAKTKIPFPSEEVQRDFEDRILNMIAGMLSLHDQHGLPDMPRHETWMKLVNSCWDLARNEPDRNLTLEDLCMATNASPRILQYAFEEMTGTSPLVFLRNHRLHKARRLLLGGAETVKESAYSCGFSELGRFSRYYRELFGENPSETLAGRVGS
jgi:hypothetical protein